MAIARKIDPNALARAFADEIRTIPEVERVWYWSKLGHHTPGVLSLDLFVLLERTDDRIEEAVSRAMHRLDRQLTPMMLAVMTFTEDDVREFGVESELRDGSIELSLHGLRR
jgi:hypothetical protein